MDPRSRVMILITWRMDYLFIEIPFRIRMYYDNRLPGLELHISSDILEDFHPLCAIVTSQSSNIRDNLRHQPAAKISYKKEHILHETDSLHLLTMEKSENGVCPKHSVWMFTRRNDVPFLFFGSIALVVGALGSPLQTYFYGKTILKLTKYLSGGYENGGSFLGEIRILCGLIMILGAARMILNWIGITLWLILGERQQGRARKEIFRILLSSNLEWFDSKENLMGSIAQVNRSIEEIRAGMSVNIGLLVQNFLSIFFLFATAMISLWSLTLVIMALAPLMAFSSWIFGRLTFKAASKENDLNASASMVLNWSFVSGDLVRLLNGKYRDMVKFNKLVDLSAEAFTKMALSIALNSSVLRLLTNLIFVQGFWFGNHMVENQQLKINQVFTTFSACLLLGSQVAETAEILTLVNKAQAAAATVGKFISLESEKQRTLISYSEIKELKRRSMTLQSVSFKYKGNDDYVLENVNASFDCNSMNFIIGKSGCGKSTLTLILMKLYTPTSGTVYIDGTSLEHFSDQWLGENVTLVELNPLVFEKLLFENLTLGNQSVPDSLVQRACSFAKLDSLIQKLPEGLNSILTSSSLSGGQIQKIGIARAWIRDTPILILDEALSAIDLVTRKEMFLAIKEWRRNKLSLVITHDVLEVCPGDQVVILESGRVKAQGYARDLGQYLNFRTEPTTRILSQLSRKTRLSSRLSRLSVYNYLHNPVILKDLEKKGSVEENDEGLQILGIFAILKYCFHTITKKWMIITGLILSLISGLLSPVLSFCISKLLSNVVNTSLTLTTKNTESAMLFWSLLLVGIAVSDGVIHFISQFSLQYASEMWVLELRKFALGIIDDQDMSFFSGAFLKPAELTALLMNDSRDLRNLVSEFLSAVVLMVALTVFGTVWSIASGWKLALVGIAFVPLVMIVNIVFGMLLLTCETEYKDSVANVENFNHNVISGIRTVKCYGLASQFETDFEIKLKVMEKKGYYRAFSTGFGLSFLELCTSVSTATILYYGMVLVSTFDYSQAQMLQVLTLLTFTLTSASSIMHQLPEIARGQRAGTLFVRLLKLDPLKVETDGNQQLHRIGKLNEPIIRFKNVSFSYPDLQTFSYQKVLNRVSFDINKGETVALVGESGIGKSTVALLLARLYEQESGSIIFCNQPLQLYDQEWYRNTISVVPQHPKFFEGTIMENLCYGMDSSKISEVQVTECLKICNIWNFVISLPNGLQTVLGEGSNCLASTGQLQMLCIARALLRKPQVLVFDECTSNLDNLNSRTVSQLMCHGLREKNPYLTVLMITHDVDIMKEAARLLVLRKGEVVEEGGHEELFAERGELYRIEK